MRDYNGELYLLRQKLERKAKVEAMLESLRSQLSELQAEELSLREASAKEQSDVDKLEKVSLASVFSALSGKKEEKLDREKAEAYAAALKYDAAVKQTQSVERYIRVLEEELAGLPGVQARYDKLVAEKAAAIRAENPAGCAEIMALEERLARIDAEKREIDEALSAGDAVLTQICSIEGDLSGAQGLGVWDLLGGGLLVDFAKHSHLDRAQTKIDELQELLRRYRTELADVTLYADIQARVDGFLRFADYFFDGLFSSLAVLGSIKSAKEQISSTHSQVNEVQGRLKSMTLSLSSEKEKLSARLRELVLNF